MHAYSTDLWVAAHSSVISDVLALGSTNPTPTIAVYDSSHVELFSATIDVPNSVVDVSGNLTIAILDQPVAANNVAGVASYALIKDRDGVPHARFDCSVGYVVTPGLCTLNDLNVIVGLPVLVVDIVIPAGPTL